MILLYKIKEKFIVYSTVNEEIIYVCFKTILISLKNFNSLVENKTYDG